MSREQERNNRQQETRSAEIRDVSKKTRRKKLNDTDADPLYVNPAEVPDGFSVEWKRCKIYGKEDTRSLTNAEKDGWEPAEPKMFPSLVGKNYKGSVIYGGDMEDLVLMIRPKELTEEAIQEERMKAVGQVKTKMEELGLSKQGEFERTRPSVNKSYDRIPVS